MLDTYAVIRHSGKLRIMENGQRIADVRTVMESTVNRDANNKAKDKAEDDTYQVFTEIAGKLQQGWVSFTKNGVVIERHYPPRMKDVTS